MNILVFTVSSWADMTGTDDSTWANLLEKYAPEQVASVCIRNEQPTSLVCSRYFCISENKVLKSIINRSIQTGKELSPGVCRSDDEDLRVHRARYRRLAGKRRYSLLLARELVWKLGRWKTPELNAFLDDFKPDVILHSMSGYIHLNRLVAYAIQRTGARAVGYIWDDNFTYKQSSRVGHIVYRYFQRRSLKELAGMTAAFFAISSSTKMEADAFFGINCQILTKPLNTLPVVRPSAKNAPMQIVYTGNLLIGRDKSLLRFANVLHEFNLRGLKFVSEVYTQTQLPAETLSELQGTECRVHSAVSQAEVFQKQKEADILLFLEDIDGQHARTSRLSFSTKITDYLSCGKCILAIGNRETAPIRYFLENDAALVCDSEESLSSAFRTLSENNELLNHYAANACAAGLKYHHPDKISRIFRETLEKVCRVA